MKVLVLENNNYGGGCGMDLALRAQSEGHDVRYWIPVENGTGKLRPYGDGMLNKPKDWHESMDWAELIVLTDNTLHSWDLAEYIGKGYPIFGPNQKSAALELDRARGQQVLEDYGVETLPYEIADNVEEAIRKVAKSKKVYCIKAWGGIADKATTCIPRTVDEAVQILHKWKEKGVKGQLMLQEKVEGVEVGISGFFGPAGWNKALEESFEFKRLMNDDIGENTGEMGTVIRHVSESKLFDKLLEPLTDYLHGARYVGDCSVNAIVNESGAWPLEFTARLGWPDFCIRQEVIKSDPVEWMADLLLGQDTLRVSSDIAVGVVVAHGDFPKQKDPVGTWAGFAIDYSEKDEEHIHWQDVMEGTVPCADSDGRIIRKKCKLTAGPYVLVAAYHGKSVLEAQKGAYAIVERIHIPSNTMWRTDIGDRLKLELPKLQKLGYAVGMRFD